MKVLWIVNLPLPDAAEYMGLRKSNIGGWLDTLSRKMGENSEIELCVAFPQNQKKKMCDFCQGNIRYLGFYEDAKPAVCLSEKMQNVMQDIVEITAPDIVHIWGSEYLHAYAMASAYGKPERTILSIQGLISIIAEHYADGLTECVKYGWTLRDLLRQDNIAQQQKRFKLRGVYERKLISELEHVIGRTEWDYASTKKMNLNIRYHKCNEILRTDFYGAKKWSFKNCRRHSLFLTQMNYPVKGFHFLLKALPAVLEQYPDTMVYVAGDNIVETPNLKAKMKKGSYARYLNKIIDEYRLREHIVFVGNLNAKQMIEQMLLSHVFVLPSTIENSSNSLGEAMLLGLPCVASNVGGTGSVLAHDIEGLLYQSDDTGMLAESINRLFADEELCMRLSDAAIKRATEDHDEGQSIHSYLDVYHIVLGKRD